MKIIVRPRTEDAVDLVAHIISSRVRDNPRLVLGLATGRTMEAVYARLVEHHRRDALSFAHCRTFNLDEYVGLRADDSHSYRRYMNQHLFHRVDINLGNTHLPDGTAKDLTIECAHYEASIVRCGGIDLQLLGIGNNGHIGFNEPLSGFDSRTHVQVLSPATREQNAPLFSGLDKVPECAITMGLKTIMECRQCLLLATGKSKAEIVAAALEGPVTNMISATALQLHSDCMVVLDEAAADGLKNKEHYRTAFETLPELEPLRLMAANEGAVPTRR